MYEYFRSRERKREIGKSKVNILNHSAASSPYTNLVAFQQLGLSKMAKSTLPYNKSDVLAALPDSDHESECDAKHDRGKVWRGKL